MTEACYTELRVSDIDLLRDADAKTQRDTEKFINIDTAGAFIDYAGLAVPFFMLAFSGESRTARLEQSARLTDTARLTRMLA